jgi:cell division transport system ATP-binding protein
MIELQNVWVEKGDATLLEGVNLTVGKGEFVYLIGPSGAGKSTLLRLIYFDERPTRGRVVVEGRDSGSIRGRDIPFIRRRIGIIFQDFKLLRDRTVLDNVAFALEVTGSARSVIHRRAMAALGAVGLTQKRNETPDHLSGGERQRVAIARALVNEPALLLADEPTGNLDARATEIVTETLRDIHRQGTAVIVATHDAALAQRYPNRTVRLESGKVKEQ